MKNTSRKTRSAAQPVRLDDRRHLAAITAPLSEDFEDDHVAPPMRGKTNPRGDMEDAVPTLDDEHRSYHHHPQDTAGVLFGFDPIAADAAADLAGELGSQFLEGATRAQDMSERVVEAEDEEEAAGAPFGIDEELGAADESEEMVRSAMEESETEERPRKA
jgi:hypothetical protein